MKKLKFNLSFLLLFFCLQASSQINWLHSYDLAKLVAKEQNKLIIVDCWATWCGPCLRMDDDVWTNEKITQYADSFVFVKIDLSYGFSNSDFIVNAIPKIFVTDAWNTQMKDFTGYQSKSKMNSVLKSFCFDISQIYDEKKEVKNKKNDIENIMRLAVTYHKVSLNLDRDARVAMQKQSNLFFKNAEKQLKKNNDETMLKRIVILSCLNKAPKKRLKILNKIDPKDKSNILLKNAILVKAYLTLEDEKSAQEFFNMVKTEELPYYDFLEEERNILN